MSTDVSGFLVIRGSIAMSCTGHADRASAIEQAEQLCIKSGETYHVVQVLSQVERDNSPRVIHRPAVTTSE